MRIGSLFSGAGGLDMAVAQVFGGEVAWHCEVDESAAKVLAHHYPTIPNLGDITTVDWSAVEPAEVLGGGFPCQDVSVAGGRAGIKAGTRSGLWAMFADAIGALRPRFVVIENVRGLLNADGEPWPPPVVEAFAATEWRRAALVAMDEVPHRWAEPAWKRSRYGQERRHRLVRQRERTLARFRSLRYRLVQRAIGTVLGELSDLGYDAQWTTIAAASVGAPHRRERVFILATLANTPRDGWDEGRPEPAGIIGRPDASLSGDGPVDLLPTPRSLDSTGVRGRTPNRSDEANYRAGRTLTDEVMHLLPTPRKSDGDGGANPLSREERMDDVETRIMRLLPTPNAQDGNGGRFNSDGHQSTLPGEARLLPTPQWGKYQPAISRWEELTRPAPSPTEPNSKGNPRLSAAFSEWMMGWPAGWVTAVPGISRNDQLRCIGNGVVPQQAVAALWWLLAVSQLDEKGCA